jgi:phosphoribosylglycinamide formyltransferase-1
MKKLKLGVFASGRGSNFQAIYQAIQDGNLNADIQLVISNNADAGALDFAREKGIPALHLDRKQFASADKFDATLLAALAEHNVDFIVLAGYMKLIRPAIVAAYTNRIMNIHPALLPAFGGKGMYGHFVHKAVLEYGCKVSGVTVHLVDEKYDHGPIILQQPVPVEEGDTPEKLAARILTFEHQVFARALQLFAEDRVKIIDGRAIILK